MARNWEEALWKPHFSVQCTCGDMWFFELTEEEAERACADKLAVLTMMSMAAKMSLSEFYSEHEGDGHVVEESVVVLAPLKVSDDPKRQN